MLFIGNSFTDRMAENVRLFDYLIKRAGSKTVLYMTWAQEHSAESQKAITGAYHSVGKELGAIVVPVGIACEKSRAKHKSPVLCDRDKSHPSIAGSYLAACTFLAVLFKFSPVGLECPSALADEGAKVLQQFVWKNFG